MRKGKSEILECFLGERQAPCRQRLFIAIFSMHSHRPSMSRIAAARAGYQFWSVICILVTSTNQQVNSTCCCNSANGDQGLCIENIIYSVYDPTIRRQQSSKSSWEKARDANRLVGLLFPDRDGFWAPGGTGAEIAGAERARKVHPRQLPQAVACWTGILASESSPIN